MTKNEKNYEEKYYSIMVLVKHEEQLFWKTIFSTKRIIEKNRLHYLLNHVRRDSKLFKGKPMKQKKTEECTQRKNIRLDFLLGQIEEVIQFLDMECKEGGK